MIIKEIISFCKENLNMNNHELILHFSSALFYVLVIIFLFFFIYKKSNFFQNIKKNQSIYILDKCYLNSSNFICTVNIYNKNFVLAVTPSKITILYIFPSLKKISYEKNPKYFRKKNSIFKIIKKFLINLGRKFNV